ncbi:MAG: Conserved putative rane protein [Amycolatopsis sp.]|jgi:hypothetical protein|uniref:hypothetical protein n=1 Tax=Amycolatopsis sp. TaxID=37632 RepID=UPI0026057351|nr:hypothetical protein [Amycolatopsis sp.]MCU1680174.1 Conserved putative rane protein [Amycolatopsis sp.]
MISWLVRVLVAAALLGSAWVHYDLWRNGFSDIAVIGPLFLVNAVAGVVIAVGVLAWSHWIPAFLAAGFGASTLGAYVLSVTVGLFNVQEQFTTQAELWGVITEAVCIVLGIALIVMAVRPGRRA